MFFKSDFKLEWGKEINMLLSDYGESVQCIRPNRKQSPRELIRTGNLWCDKIPAVAVPMCFVAHTGETFSSISLPFSLFFQFSLFLT